MAAVGRDIFSAEYASPEPQSHRDQRRASIHVFGSICQTYFDALTQTLLDIGVLSSATGTLQNCHRVWCADEKGMTDGDGKLKFQTGLSIKQLGAPTCSAGQSGFKHISVLPFISLDGRVSDPYIVVSGAAQMNAWSSVWPGAHIRCSEKGAVTTELFSEFYAHFCQWIRKTVPVNEEVVVILDSGGGSLSHLSTEVGVLSAKYRVRPFYLPPYHTAAVMALDQAPNREFERRWSEIRSRQSNFSQLQAVDACHEAFDAGYNRKTVLQGFESTGMTMGMPMNRAKVILERGPQLSLSFI